MSQLITTKELSDRLSVTTDTVLKWSREGKLPPPIKIGRGLRWTEESVDAFLKSQEGSK